MWTTLISSTAQQNPRRLELPNSPSEIQYGWLINRSRRAAQRRWLAAPADDRCLLGSNNVARDCGLDELGCIIWHFTCQGISWLALQPTVRSSVLGKLVYQYDSRFLSPSSAFPRKLYALLYGNICASHSLITGSLVCLKRPTVTAHDNS